MSSIETVYGERIAERLCDAIEALGAATAAYQTTGDALTGLAAQRRDTQQHHDAVEEQMRALFLAAPDLGKNDRERAANLAMHLRFHPDLAARRVALTDAQERHEEAERAHKSAYHHMESLRVAITGYAAVLGATH